MIPGEIITAADDIILNDGCPSITLTVANTGDRPIQVGSHYHFAETNAALSFDRNAARGMRLDIAAGTAVRFEPGQQREVRLIPFAGARRIFGFNQAVMGPLDPPSLAGSMIIERLVKSSAGGVDVGSTPKMFLRNDRGELIVAKCVPSLDQAKRTLFSERVLSDILGIPTVRHQLVHANGCLMLASGEVEFVNFNRLNPAPDAGKLLVPAAFLGISDLHFGNIGNINGALGIFDADAFEDLSNPLPQGLLVAPRYDGSNEGIFFSVPDDRQISCAQMKDYLRNLLERVTPLAIEQTSIGLIRATDIALIKARLNRLRSWFQSLAGSYDETNWLYSSMEQSYAGVLRDVGANQRSRV